MNVETPRSFARPNPVIGPIASEAPAMRPGDIPAIAAGAQAAFARWSTFGPNARRNGATVHDEAQMPFGGKAGIDAFTGLRWISVETQGGHFPI